jgi:hypothetical protein
MHAKIGIGQVTRPAAFICRPSVAGASDALDTGTIDPA